MHFEVTVVNVFFLNLIINIVYSNRESILFMVHNLEKNEYYCITNSSWVSDTIGRRERGKQRQSKLMLTEVLSNGG
jgi:hypothetical protein